MDVNLAARGWHGSGRQADSAAECILSSQCQILLDSPHPCPRRTSDGGTRSRVGLNLKRCCSAWTKRRRFSCKRSVSASAVMC
jgi:hypothetical protein